MTARALLNERTTRGVAAGESPSRDPLTLHRRLPGYRPTPLVRCARLAAELGLETVAVKDEGLRLGLPSFKILGASWAVYRALEEHLGTSLEPWDDAEDLRARLEQAGPLTLAAATDGNHGRAVAHVAAMWGLGARIFVPEDTVAARIDAIAGEGAEVVVVEGGYDDAVALSAEQAGPSCLVISDTSWEGYTDVPGWVIDGYSTIYWEIEDELEASGEEPFDLAVVQIGVGALAAALTRHFRRPGLADPPAIVGVEPEQADCMTASIEAGRVVTIPGPQRSIMSGMNCGTPSVVAWPIVAGGVDAFLVVPDEAARHAMRDLAREGVVAGETGAAGLAALRALLEDPATERVRSVLGRPRRVLLLSTEGATDPVAYREIVG